jgi:hypothetical protein
LICSLYHLVGFKTRSYGLKQFVKHDVICLLKLLKKAVHVDAASVADPVLESGDPVDVEDGDAR